MVEHLTLGSVDDVARITGINKRTLNQLRCYRPDEGPPFFHLGRRVFYPLRGENSLESWIAERIATEGRTSGSR